MIAREEIQGVEVVSGLVEVYGRVTRGFLVLFGYPLRFLMPEVGFARGCIRVHSGRGTVRFGFGLPREELEWLRSAIGDLLGA